MTSPQRTWAVTIPEQMREWAQTLVDQASKLRADFIEALEIRGMDPNRRASYKDLERALWSVMRGLMPGSSIFPNEMEQALQSLLGSMGVVERDLQSLRQVPIKPMAHLNLFQALERSPVHAATLKCQQGILLVYVKDYNGSNEVWKMKAPFIPAYWIAFDYSSPEPILAGMASLDIEDRDEWMPLANLPVI